MTGGPFSHGRLLRLACAPIGPLETGERGNGGTRYGGTGLRAACGRVGALSGVRAASSGGLRRLAAAARPRLTGARSRPLPLRRLRPPPSAALRLRSSACAPIGRHGERGDGGTGERAKKGWMKNCVLSSTQIQLSGGFKNRQGSSTDFVGASGTLDCFHLRLRFCGSALANRR